MSGSTQEPREAWSEVGRRFEELGRVLREHFSPPGSTPDSATWSAADADADADAPDAGASSGAPAGGSGGRTDAGPGGGSGDRAAVQDALQRLGQAVQRLGDQAEEAVRDRTVRVSAQQAARTLGDALAATFTELGDQLRSRVGSSPRSGQAEPEPAPRQPAAPPEIVADGGPPDVVGDRPPGVG